MDLVKTRCRSVPSLLDATHKRDHPLLIRAATYFSGLICMLGCAGETQERPVETQRQTHSITPLPLPSSAFSDDAQPGASATSLQMQPQAPDRFATKSLGTGESSESGSSPRYSGARVDLDLKEASVHDVFRLLADVGKVNIVVAGEVTGTITLRMKHVPWDQAMDVIARVRGLVYERDGNVILVRGSK